ncbi:DUF350 domain-containing protein [Pseudomonas protegens]|jgi:putative membrane protein|uniref:DUF350 domain-containing protein n=4 Tax=Pseudomonas TaxID=286 RepID=Q4K4Q7_PSEF5|nr:MULTISPECIES: DUF350 domain-containing protein [Pseudomonas]BCQ65377.1 DUF350 domain-containing protein [Pseudomonas sp. Boi14]AAY94908.2 conserved hypothetical protein [Pseudomonas protegens Pf-5]AGL87396.1 hypothetical protein PFLCHA0_c56680 [Pseudomonas protegens CHA0]ASE20940.1 DUF350 domain-containing protein [Pseudomonas protegens]MBP5099475.1 DUF350 domain-containing protein [Pseudomonas protegens]
MFMDALKMSLPADAVLGFMLYMLGAALVFALYAFIYTRLTPYNEFALIREGNSAASIALSGALLGFAIPVASAISHSISIIDFLLWAGIAAVVQLLAFFVVSLILKGLSQRIASQEYAAAILVASVSVGVGLLNAACMTPSV